MIQGSDGNFYGTTQCGGSSSTACSGSFGTVFKLSPAGSLTTLHVFSGGADGRAPRSPLVQGKDGNFYGTTFSGGNAGSFGTVFKITPAGVLTTLYAFTNGADGEHPQAGLLQGSDGNFYGTATNGGTTAGGKSGLGTVFKLDEPGNTFTPLHAFAGANDGGSPQAGLIVGGDGNFYGTTTFGGSGGGTVFRITPLGVWPPWPWWIPS